mgnify:CR=1 FL=1
MILDEVMVVEAAQGKPRASGDDPPTNQPVNRYIQ